MMIAIASDHRGVNCKKILIDYLNSLNYTVLDESPVNTPTDDYPDFAFKVCKDIINKKADLGILLCGTGIGMSIAANKVKGIRCAKVDSVEEAILARNDNGSNVMTFSYKKDIDELKKIIVAFIEAESLTDDRHKRRVNKIIDYENGAYNEL